MFCFRCFYGVTVQGGGQKNVRYKITRNQYENQSRFDFPQIIVSS